MAPRASARPPKRIFHKIGEVCELTKTEPYVLRYWESEFPFLAPEKNRAGQRIYSDDDIQMVLAIKKLLYEEGYTTAGARRRLERDLSTHGPTGAEAAESETEDPLPSPRGPGAKPERARAAGAAAAEDGEAVRLRDALRTVRDGLQDVLAVMQGRKLEPPAAPAPRPAPSRRRR